MKKILFLTVIFGAIISAAASAQGPQKPQTAQNTAPDPAVMLQQMKDRIVPQMVEKTGLTEALVNKVIEINFEFRMQASRELKDLNEADRSKKLADLKAAKEKRISEILTPEQIKAVNAFYEDMAKTPPQKN